MSVIERVLKVETHSLQTARYFIDQLFDKNPSFVDGAYGIKIVEYASNRPSDEDCAGYIFGDEDPNMALSRLVDHGIRTECEEGSIAMYLDEKNVVVHFGKVVENGDIVSKWGCGGHVYKHKPLYTLP